MVTVKIVIVLESFARLNPEKLSLKVYRRLMFRMSSCELRMTNVVGMSNYELRMMKVEYAHFMVESNAHIPALLEHSHLAFVIRTSPFALRYLTPHRDSCDKPLLAFRI